MNPDSKTRLITITEVGVIIAVLVLGLLVGWYLSRRSGTGPTDNGTGTTQTGGPTSNTVSDVGNIDIPEPGDTQSGDLAVPNSVTDAAPGVAAQARSYTVSVNNNEFSPSQIALRVGDTVSIRFTAQDKDYDFTQPDLGLSAKLLKGKEQLIQVSPTQQGKFTFFCSSCGGPDKGPVGYLLVAPQQ